jgi:uroporphyrin-III C-methyltransferase/precorrin-2 dehydrogenase/sirohydrochlorin ferrochelatase
MDSVFLVIAATDNPVLNKQVYSLAQERQLFVNVVDNPDLCSFIFPSIVDRSPVMIAISSGGKAPVLIKLIRERLEALLPANLGDITILAGKWRERVKRKIHSLSGRRLFWEKLFRGNFISIAKRNMDNAEKYLKNCLDDFDYSQGKVTLAGAGPGDAGLLTLNALQALQEADVILYDQLVSREILTLSRRDSEKIFVGKKAGNHSLAQEKINNLIIFHALQGKHVVRLKGGDPFIFGRGGEELEIIKKHNLPFEVIPGITAATGAAAYSNIPLTHRNFSNGITFITGCHQNKEKNPEWETWARINHTLVIYMGTLKAKEIQNNLILNGKDRQTPIAIVSRATCKDQKVLRGSLKDLSFIAEKAEMPALLIIGQVTSFYEHFKFSDRSFKPEVHDFIPI